LLVLRLASVCCSSPLVSGTFDVWLRLPHLLSGWCYSGRPRRARWICLCAFCFYVKVSSPWLLVFAWGSGGLRWLYFRCDLTNARAPLTFGQALCADGERRSPCLPRRALPLLPYSLSPHSPCHYLPALTF
jgi:hypothetical protein